jgi:hypothetical protein
MSRLPADSIHPQISPIPQIKSDPIGGICEICGSVFAFLGVLALSG